MKSKRARKTIRKEDSRIRTGYINELRDRLIALDAAPDEVTNRSLRTMLQTDCTTDGPQWLSSSYPGGCVQLGISVSVHEGIWTVRLSAGDMDDRVWAVEMPIEERFQTVDWWVALKSNEPVSRALLESLLPPD